MRLDEMFRNVLAMDPDEPAVEVGETWYPRRRLTDVAKEIDNILKANGLGEGTPIGLVARNRVPQVGALFGLIAGRRTVVMLHAYQAPSKLAEEIRNLRLPAVLADEQDWAGEGMKEAAQAAGSIGVVLKTAETGAVSLLPGLEKPGPGPHHKSDPDVAIEILTSGTTGAPKRVPMTYSTLNQATADAAVATQQAGTAQDLKEPYVQFYPLGNISGVYGLLLCAGIGRPLILLEKFSVAGWVRAVEKYRLKTFVSLPPAAVRMVLEAKVPKSALASLSVVRCGSAPLAADLQAEFEDTYDIPVLINYGATEFGGVVINWTLEDHKKFARQKRGSIGRARPGIGLRVIEPDSGREKPTGEVGLLEILVPRLKDEWIRTTDLAAIDSDGFVFLHGRSDSVIIRGGFKVNPEAVAEVLRQHPKVREAAVIGIPDPRLGEVPVAAVEGHPGQPRPTPAELEELARKQLSPQQVPVRTVVFDALPRTGSMKVDRGALKKMLQA